MTQWIIQRLADEALGILPPIFAHAFGEAIELPVLRWKYATGYGESWLAQTPTGLPVVHCGLLFRDVQFAGQRARIAQLVDLAAATGKQGLARRNGAFSCLMHPARFTLAPCRTSSLTIATCPRKQAIAIGSPGWPWLPSISTENVGIQQGAHIIQLAAANILDQIIRRTHKISSKKYHLGG